MKAMVILGLFFLIHCSPSEPTPQPNASTQKTASSNKDLLNFNLSEDVKKNAPLMQNHLMAMIPYNTYRWKVKPMFAFTEQQNASPKTNIVGVQSALVDRMNLIHVALWENDTPILGYSLMLGLHQNVGITTEKGDEIKIVTAEDTIHYRLERNGVVFETEFPHDQDHETWVTQGEQRLYLNHYRFPDTLVNGRMRGETSEK